MGIQETTDIIITFFQNLVLLVDIPNVEINWPPMLEEPIRVIKMVVSFDFLKDMVGRVSLQIETLDIHVMLALKNALLPFLVAALVIVPLQRWYYAVWWAFTLVAAIGATLGLAATSYFAQQPTTIGGVKVAHGHTYIYNNGYDPVHGLAGFNPSRGIFHETFNQTTLIIAGALTVAIVIGFFIIISIGLAVFIINFVRARKKKLAKLKEKQKQAPPGKKVNRQNFEFQYTYNEIQEKVAAEKQLNVRTYLSRIAPLILIILGILIFVGVAIYLYVVISGQAEDSFNIRDEDNLFNVEELAKSANVSVNQNTVNMIFIISMVVSAILILVAICFIGFNSLVLFEKPRAMVYTLKNFFTSKALKLVFLVVSSFYIPLAVQIFAMFDCVTISCDAGQHFNHRKDNTAAYEGYEQYFTRLLQDPATCTSCYFDQTAIIGTNTSTSNYTAGIFSGMSAASIALANRTADSLCVNVPQALQSAICPASTEYRLSRSTFIACSSIYPYVGFAALLSLLFVLTTPFIIFYLIFKATKMLNTVIVSHLYDYRQRQIMRTRLKRRQRRRRFKRGEARKGWQDFRAELISMTKHDATNAYNSAVKDIKIRGEKDIKWEMRIHLVDCSIESLYFPYKYFFRYYKLLFMMAKVVLAFTNVFGVTVFGLIPNRSTIGGQIVLWTTFGVQFMLGLITIIIRPHMILAESLLLMLSSISICSNCLFGLFLLYSQIDIPWFVTTAFMAANTIILGIGAAASLFFYFYRIYHNSYKRIQRRMKSLLKNRVNKIIELRKKRMIAERKKYRKSRKKLPKNLFKRKQEITPEDIMPTDKQINAYFQQKKEPLLPLFPSKYTYETVKSLIQYQHTVAYTLNRTSLNVLINYFFILSVISAVAGLLIAVHYFVQYTTPHYSDPYIQTPIKAFAKPIAFENVWEYSDQHFTVPHTSSQFRNATERLIEGYTGFQRFPYPYCEVAFDYHFAEYDSWDSFTDNCCCTRDHEFEALIKSDKMLGLQDTLAASSDLVVENWRCKNGKIKRRLRQLRYNFVKPSQLPSEFRFQINATNYKQYVMNGFELRGLCSKTFNPGFSMERFKKESFCAALPTLDTFDMSKENQPTFMIAPEPTITDAFLYQGFSDRVTGNYTTAGYTHIPISERNKAFWGVSLDAYFSVLTRAHLY